MPRLLYGVALKDDNECSTKIHPHVEYYECNADPVHSFVGEVEGKDSHPFEEDSRFQKEHRDAVADGRYPRNLNFLISKNISRAG